MATQSNTSGGVHLSMRWCLLCSCLWGALTLSACSNPSGGDSGVLPQGQTTPSDHSDGVTEDVAEESEDQVSLEEQQQDPSASDGASPTVNPSDPSSGSESLLPTSNISQAQLDSREELPTDGNSNQEGQPSPPSLSADHIPLDQMIIDPAPRLAPSPVPADPKTAVRSSLPTAAPAPPENIIEDVPPPKQ